jgi:hypothetical protein
MLLLCLSALGAARALLDRTLSAERRRELRLCAGAALALAIFAAMAHPTLERYFFLTVPFLSILATYGLIATASRVIDGRASAIVILVVIGVFAMDDLRWIVSRRAVGQILPSRWDWQRIETTAREVASVSPPGEPLFADEAIYFATAIRPPRGLENKFSARLSLPPGRAERLHVVPAARIDAMLRAGRFGAVVLWSDDARIARLDLVARYRNHRLVGDDLLLWGPAESGIAEGTPPP